MMNSNKTWCMDKSGQDKEINKNGTPKNDNKIYVKSKTRRTYLRDKRAPKPPNSGYIRFLNDRRDQFSSQNSNIQFAEITKVLATEWNQMPADKKQTYLLAAEQERKKYIEELEAYKKTDAYKNFLELKSNRKKYEQQLKKEKPSNNNKFKKKDPEIKKENPSNDNKLKKDQELKKTKPSTTTSGVIMRIQSQCKNLKEPFYNDQELKKTKPSTTTSGDQKCVEGKPSISCDNSNTVYDIPIFTEEFLNFNKARDSELRDLRKKVTDQEQEVCVLDKHIENMENVSTKLGAINEQLKAGCSKYEHYLIKLRSRLLDAFSNTAFPDNTVPLTHENIDTYIVNYFTHQETSTDTDPSWITYFKKGLTKLDTSQC